ncbi:MAG: aminotransferase class IV [Patescibacteria group bacterium]
MKISVNGNIVLQKDAFITIADKAVWYDFGVYENIKVLQGTLMWPEMHMKRLFTSAEVIGLELGETEETLLRWVCEYAEALKLKDHIIKVCAYGDADKNTRATVYLFAIGLTFYPDQFYAKGVAAITFAGERNLPNAKSMDTLLNFLAFREAKAREAFEALLVDHEGDIREGSRSNLYIVEKGIVITPPLSDVLEGVTRILVLKLLKENDIALKEERISKSRLMAADEVFVTATSSNVMSVVEIDGKKIGAGTPGEVTKRIIKLYREMQKEYLRSKSS